MIAVLRLNGVDTTSLLISGNGIDMAVRGCLRCARVASASNATRTRAKSARGVAATAASGAELAHHQRVCVQA